MPGTWDLSRDGSTRRCVLTLAGASGPAGRRLSFPAGCRRALPILNGVAGWLFTDGNLRLVDKDVRPVLQFSARVDARSLVAAAGDEHFSLVPLQIVAMVPPTTLGWNPDVSEYPYDPEAAKALLAEANELKDSLKAAGAAETEAERRRNESELEAKLEAAQARIADIKAKALADVGAIAEDAAEAILTELSGKDVSREDVANAVRESR